MAQSEEMRILWKTNCKWRDTDYIVTRKDVRPLVSKAKDDTASIIYKPGDAVKVKWGSRWYDAEIVEVGGRSENKAIQSHDDADMEKKDDQHYLKFLGEQRKRESEWKIEREQLKLRKKKKQDNEHDHSSIFKSQDSEQRINSTHHAPKVSSQNDTGSFGEILRQCELLKSRMDDLDAKAASAIDMLKMIEEVKFSITENFSNIEKRLESLEKIAKFPENIIKQMESSIKTQLCVITQQLESIETSSASAESTFNSTLDNSSELFAEELSPPVNPTTEEFQLSTIDINALRCLVESDDNAPQTTEYEPDETSSTSDHSPNSDETTNKKLSDDIIRKFVTPSKDVKKISAAMEGSNEPRKCAIRLLPFFVSENELCECNTDGTHGKRALHPVRLNSLKVMLFMRFVLKCKDDEEVV